ncbi:hypothetical protein [Paraclostridium bifermentans]|uniref:hypothetical protein n=1 Tax=Paraclostridium bifermentans TaxID=1490 RepID=UPI0025B17FFF|nr:hypothetical protein [Paraclostridium bifermentans]
MKELLLDVATVYYGDIDMSNPDNFATILTEEKVLGVTRGGLKVEAKPNIREIEFDGRNGKKIAGMDRILGWEVKAETEALEATPTVFTANGFVKDSTSSTKFDKYIPGEKLTHKDLVLVGKLYKSDQPCIIHIKNAYSGEGLAFEQKDGEEAGFKMAFVGAYTLGSDEMPIDVYYPKAPTK